MTKNKSKQKLKEAGITLIALVVTIIILLILAGVTLSLVLGNQGLIGKAQLASNTMAEATRNEMKKMNEYVDDVDELTTGYINPQGGGETNLTADQTTIAKSTEKTDSYVGYYADIDNDGDVDGIIYADMIVGNTKSGRWNNDDWSDYNVTKINDASSVKDYVVSSKIYEGQIEAGIYKANDGFGTKEVLVPATNGAGTKDRFYLMTLENFSVKDSENNDITTFYWYNSASYSMLDDTIGTSAVDFGEGKAKTIKEINRWNAKTYGDQNERDLWGVIQNKIGATKDADEKVTDCKWFVPSKAEWSAFGEELGINSNNYVNKGLSDWYWSSSQYYSITAYFASFRYGYIGSDDVDTSRYVRLSTTF